MAYFKHVPEYIRRCLLRINTGAGILIGVIVFIVWQVAPLSTRIMVLAEIGILAAVITESGYGVFRQERARRSKLEQGVRILATVSRFAQNMPDPGKDKASLEVYLLWEMWARVETATDQLALNLIYVSNKQWWQFWKKGKSPKLSMTRNGQDSNRYRRTLAPPGALQPDRDEGVFTWLGERQGLRDVRRFELELVLVTGMPHARYSVPVAIDWEAIRSRGTNPPL